MINSWNDFLEKSVDSFIVQGEELKSANRNFERKIIDLALFQARGDVAKAAAKLKISSKYICDKARR